MARQVPHADVCDEPAARSFGPIDRQFGRRFLEIGDRRADRRFHLDLRRDDTEVAAIPVEHALHEEIPADEGVARESLARRAEHRRDRRVLLDDRHMAGLAAALFACVRAVLPFLKRHLLGQLADDLSLGPARFRDQRMAGRAQLRLPDVHRLGRLETGRRLHDGRHAAFDLERSEHLARSRCARRTRPT